MGEFTKRLVEFVEGWYLVSNVNEVDKPDEKELLEHARKVGQSFEEKFGVNDKPMEFEFYKNLGYKLENSNSEKFDISLEEGDKCITEERLACAIISDYNLWRNRRLPPEEVGAVEAQMTTNDFEVLMNNYQNLITS